MKKTLKNECSNIDLQDVINAVIGKNKILSELDVIDLSLVLLHISENKLNLRIFKNKCYDILSKKFIVIEFKYKHRDVIRDKIEFDNFDTFYEYVNGDIYENTCFYGYHFTEEDIKKYKIELNNINFTSLINETIDDYSFDAFLKKQDEINKSKESLVLELNEWLINHQTITNLNEVKTLRCNFINTFEAKMNSKKLDDIFFSFYLRSNKEEIKDAIIKYYCKDSDLISLSFDQILLTYGSVVAKKIIGLMKEYQLPQTTFDREKRCEYFETSQLNLKRIVYFDKDYYLYVLKDTYSTIENNDYIKTDYFLTFEELINFVDGDLSNADLSNAPIDKNSILKFKTNEFTLFPIPLIMYDAYSIDKKYIYKSNHNVFVVEQYWYNNNNLIKNDTHQFDYFFDFVYFLKGDLSNADLISCDGLENVDLTKFKIDNIRVRSHILYNGKLKEDNFITIKDTENVNCMELSKGDSYTIQRYDDYYYDNIVSYVTDIHLPNRVSLNKCKTKEDIIYVIRKISFDLSSNSNAVNLIGGDVSNDFELYKLFFKQLCQYKNENSGHYDYFITLGNHELWGQNSLSLSQIIDKYKSTLLSIDSSNFHLVQNNVFYFDYGWKEITENKLNTMSINKLKNLTRTAKVIIFGGIGFAGENLKFNANNCIYKDTITRDQEVAESRKFKLLYEKIVLAFKGNNLIILTHMPIKDWYGEHAKYEEGVIYVSGHTHNNYYSDDGQIRVYCDNQIGYNGKEVYFKTFGMNFGYDFFKEYSDGIHEITREDYYKFYRGFNSSITFNREFDKLYMLKKQGNYMFLIRNKKGKLLTLNGGLIKSANNDLKHYYYKLDKYVESINTFMSQYNQFQRVISKEIKMIGGEGKIHGAIIDIDYYNHIYVNPLDGTLIPYFATSIYDKYTYANIPSLLKTECPVLYNNYNNIIKQNDGNKLMVLYNPDYKLSKRKKRLTDTMMYKYSRFIKSLQFTTTTNVVRLWSDDFYGEPTEEIGKSIVAKMLKSLPDKD